MSYATAYTASFHSLAGTAWAVEIDLPGHSGQPQDVGLAADRPVAIEWQETKVSDALQPSTCVLKVVNDSDRQMLGLMGERMARCRVTRDGETYWTGLLDDAVYEEPYSYSDGYVTELTFSDFGILNRRTYEADGVKSLLDIINECLAAAGLDGLQLDMRHSLMYTLIRPAGLGGMYVNTRRFDGMTMRETLDGVLSALGMRLVQTGGALLAYDIDRMVNDALDDPDTIVPVTWMGTDARLRGSEGYGRFELDFDRMSEPVAADGSMDPDKANWAGPERYFVRHYETNSVLVSTGFYVGFGTSYGVQPPLPKLLHADARYFRTLPAMTDSHDAGVAYRAHGAKINETEGRHLLATSTEWSIQHMSPLFSVTSRRLPNPTTPLDYQLRVSLRLLFSVKRNPFEEASEQGEEVRKLWEKWQKTFQRIYVPVKLELVDDSGLVVMHYVNAKFNADDNNYMLPKGMDKGSWESGAAQWGDMLLAYYADGLDANPLDGWTGNRTALESDRTQVPDIVKSRADGEYVPLPNAPGRLRLTVANGVSVDRNCNADLGTLYGKIRWQLYSDPTITLVRSGLHDDGVDTDDVVAVDVPDPTGDTFSETSVIGCGGGEVSPAALGVLFNGDGLVYSGFFKNGTRQTLLRHRLHGLTDQLCGVRPTLSGTAALAPRLSLRSDASTPGLFLPLGMAQDLREDTEEIVMALAREIPDRYSFAWSDPVCAREEQGYSHAWSGPVCVRLPDSYTFAWSSPVCARRNMTIGPVWENI